MSSVIDDIEDQMRKTDVSWTKLAYKMNKHPSNMKRLVEGNIKKVNKWLRPLGLKLKIEKIK